MYFSILPRLHEVSSARLRISAVYVGVWTATPRGVLVGDAHTYFVDGIECTWYATTHIKPFTLSGAYLDSLRCNHSACCSIVLVSLPQQLAPKI